jgi:NADPH:quinone reductase
MKAAILRQLGRDEPFYIVDLVDANPGPHEVRIAVRASSINPVETKIRNGTVNIAPEGDIVLGCDVAGVIDALGPGVTRFSLGDTVYGCAGGVKGRDGAYRERMIADSRLLALKPKNLSFAEAAALPLVSITAWEALVERAALRPGERVLVHGGTGGVGHIAVQLARSLGAIVHATVSSRKTADIAARLGADAVIDYQNVLVSEYVASNTGGIGYDVIFDTVGGDNIVPSLDALAVNGRCVTIVSLGATPDLGALHLKNARLDVVFMLVPMLTGIGLERHSIILERIAALVETGKLIPLLDEQRFGLDAIGLAHERVQSGAAVGKVIVEI